MTAETSNARGEWVLVPREPTPEMVQASDEISCRAEGAEHWAAMLAAAPQPPSAPVGVKTLSEFMAEQEALHPGIHDKVQAAADELRASLAQQPAAVDGVHKAIRKVRNIATGAAEHPAQGPKHADGMRRACNIIEAALAAQQGGA